MKQDSNLNELTTTNLQIVPLDVEVRYRSSNWDSNSLQLPLLEYPISMDIVDKVYSERFSLFASQVYHF